MYHSGFCFPGQVDTGPEEPTLVLMIKVLLLVRITRYDSTTARLMQVSPPAYYGSVPVCTMFLGKSSTTEVCTYIHIGRSRYLNCAVLHTKYLSTWVIMGTYYVLVLTYTQHRSKTLLCTMYCISMSNAKNLAQLQEFRFSSKALSLSNQLQKSMNDW